MSFSNQKIRKINLENIKSRLQLAVLFFVISIFCNFSSIAFAFEPNCSGYPAAYAGAGNSVADPYQVSSLADLQCMKTSPSGYFVLTDNIDATDTITWNSGLGFEPISTGAGIEFKGGLDGMGHVISNLFINRPLVSSALIGSTNWETKYIRNIGLENVNITGGYLTGGIATTLDVVDPFENVYITGAITGEASNSVAGGIAAVSQADSIRNCFVNADIVTKNWKGGGFIGENFSTTIENSYFSGSVSGNGGSSLGIIVADDKVTSGNIKNVFYNSETVPVDVPACHNGCDEDMVIGKTAVELGQLATFTNLETAGLVAPVWDFVGNPNNDVAVHNYWDMATMPVLAIFSGLADQDGDGYTNANDCNDRNADFHVVAMHYADADGDGYGDLVNTIQACVSPAGYVSNANDCDDTNNAIFLHTFYADVDGDGYYGVSSTSTQVCGDESTVTPSGYSAEGGDCDDVDVNIYPLRYYQDQDSDGYGDHGTESVVCNNTPAPDGYVLLDGDGDDNDSSVNPGVHADITIGTNVVASNIEPLGANLTTVAGGTNFAINNFVESGGFEPAIFRELHRVEATDIDSGYRWFRWDSLGGLDYWDTRSTGFFNGATVRFYRLVDDKGDSIPYSGGLGDVPDADHVVFLGEASVPMPSIDLSDGGFIAIKDGLKRMYIDQPLDLAYGDYAFVYLKKKEVPKSEIAERIWQYMSAQPHPVVGTNNGSSGYLVDHPGVLPAEFMAENPGETCLKVDAPNAGSVNISQYIYQATLSSSETWYSLFHPGNTYRAEVWMRQDGLADNGHVYLNFSGSYASANQVSPWTVTGEWQKFTYDFIGPAYPGNNAIMQHIIKFTGPGNLYIDNWAIYQYDAKNGFKPFGPHENSLDPILASFPETGKKPSVRFYSIEYGNSSIESMLGEFGDSSYYVNSGSITAGSERGTIAQSIRWAYATGDSPETRIVPWLTLSEEYTEVEFKALIEYLGVPYDPVVDTPTTKPYAYKRYVQRGGDGTPWTNEFREILFEYGNETWHQGAGGYGWHGFGAPGAVHSGGKEYGLFAKYMFDEQIETLPEWTANDLGSKIKFIYNANYSTSNTSYGELAAQQGGDISYLGHANYTGPKWETGDTGITSINDHGVQASLIGLYGAKTTIDGAATMLASFKSNGIVDYRVVAYEGGPSGYWMNPDHPEIDEYYGKSLAMGVGALDTWLYSSLKGYGYQNDFAFASGKWWTSHTMPEQGGFRAHPGWLALTMRNRYAMGTDMVSATVNTAPTYLREGSLTPLVSSYAMRDEQGDYSVFVLSRKLDGKHDDADFGDGYTPVTIHLPVGLNPAKVTLHKLASPDGSPADPRDNNMDSEKIAIVSEDIDINNYSSDFVINENTGGGANGMPPGTVYLYTFELIDTAANKAITDFSFTNPSATGTVDEGNKTVAITVSYGTNLTSLVPTIIHTGLSISPNTGVAQDFSNSVTYTVTAEDSSTQEYVITVNVSAPSNVATITSGAYTVSAGGTANETISNIPFETSKATFLAAIFKGQINQIWDDSSIEDPLVSGNTIISTAQDGTTVVNYVVTVNDEVVNDSPGEIIEEASTGEIDIPRPKIKVEGENAGIESYFSDNRKIKFSGNIPELADGKIVVKDDGEMKDKNSINAKGDWSFKLKFKKTSQIKIYYYDKDGNEVASKKYTIKIDSENPKFVDLPLILNKKAGDKIWWKVSDNRRVDHVRYEIAGKANKTKRDYFFLPTDISRGPHQLKMIAYDGVGNRETRNVLVWIR